MSDFEDGDRVKVRKLSGIYAVTGSRLVSNKRRYHMKLVTGTGGFLEDTEAFSEDMQLAPRPAPAPELSLAPDPQPANSPAQELALADGSPGSPEAERSAADAISSPGDTNFALDAGAFGGELDEYSPGAQEPCPKKFEMKYPAKKKLRRPPADSIPYHKLKDILYSGWFIQFLETDDAALAELDRNTPVAVAATRERNGSAVWIIVVADGDRNAILEAFYPTEAHEESSAIEHAVLLALREVPIRTPDLEVMLLQL